MNRFLLAFLTIILGFGFAWRLSLAQRELPEGNIHFTATIKQTPTVANYQQVTVGGLKITTDLFPKFLPGDRIEVAGEAQKGTMYFPKIVKIGQEKSIYLSLLKFRQKLTQNVSQFLPNKEATLVVGTVIGIDSIEPVFRKQLINTGTIHVVVVSGQNLAIVAGVFASFAPYIGRKRAMIMATAAVGLFAVFAGFEPPVVRATIMVLVATIGVFFGREANAIWTIFVAALLILFWTPHALFEISFQLTFAATLGISTFGRYLVKTFNFKLSRQGRGSPMATIFNLFWKNAAIAISAFVFTAPVILYHFGRVSLLSPIANLFVAEAVLPIMVLGFATTVASIIFMPLGAFFALFAYVPTFYFVKVVEFFSFIKFGQFEIEVGLLAVLVVPYILLFAFYYFFGRNKKIEA